MSAEARLAQIHYLLCLQYFGAFNLKVYSELNIFQFTDLFIYSSSLVPGLPTLTQLSFLSENFPISCPLCSSTILQGSIKKKIESLRRWSSASIKRPPKPKAKTLSLSSPVGDPDDVWLQEGDRRKLRPIVDSVFGQVGHPAGHYMWPTSLYVSTLLKKACVCLWC